MVANAFKVLGHHQQIDAELAAFPVLANQLDELLLHLVEELVHHVVVLHHLVGQGQVLADEGVDGVCHHLDGGLGHLLDVHLAEGDVPLLQVGQQLRNVRGLVANALQVGNHLQRRGNLPQIAGHRLLLQQQAHAQVFNLPLFLVNLQLDGFYFFGQLHVVFQQSLGGGGNGVLTQGAGGNQRNVKLFQLLVKFGSHLVFVPFCISQTGR